MRRDELGTTSWDVVDPMDVTTSKLITLCYALFAVILCTLGYFFYQAQARPFSPQEVVIVANSPVARTVPVLEPQTTSRRMRFEVERLRSRVNELQMLLDKREGILQLQASQLEDHTEQYRKLQQAATEYHDLFFEVIQESVDRVDLAVLDERTTLKPAYGEQESDETLDTLQVALDASQWELEESILLATESEASASAAEQRFTVLRQAVIDLGEIAVPTWIGLLGDQEPDVRAWAAAALGKMGPDAINAVDALQASTEDLDSRVRAAATTSIQEIRESW